MFVSSVYLVHNLLREDPKLIDDAWSAGYKVLFIVAAVKSLLAFLHLHLTKLSEKARQLQYAALATTGKGEVLALYREERLADSVSLEQRYSKRALGHPKQIAFTPHDKYNPAPVFWCILVILLLVYNTAHLALVPLSHTSPLFFGTPAFAVYWGCLRLIQIMLS